MGNIIISAGICCSNNSDNQVIFSYGGVLLTSEQFQEVKHLVAEKIANKMLLSIDEANLFDEANLSLEIKKGVL